MKKSGIFLLIICFAVSLLTACDRADNETVLNDGTMSGLTESSSFKEPIVYPQKLSVSSEATPSGNRIIYDKDKGVYYVLCDGVGESSIPSSNAIGGFLIVLVEKNEFTSIGTFDYSGELVKQVKDQCDYMIDKNYLTKRKAEIIIQAAEKIQSSWVESGIADKTQCDNIDPVDKIDPVHDEEYAQWGLQMGDDAYYYNNERVRILLDLRADNSIANFVYNRDGSVDLRLVRDDGAIVKSEYISKDEAAEILSDLDISPSTDKATANSLKKGGMLSEDIVRHTIEEVPGDVQKVIDSCNNEAWYVIEGQERKYIYYGNLHNDFAYQYEPNKSEVAVIDIGKTTGNDYVLLSIPLSSDLTISYNSKSVAYTKVAL